MSVLFNISLEALSREEPLVYFKDGTQEYDDSPKAEKFYATLTPAERDIILRYRVLKAQNKTEDIEKLIHFLDEASEVI